jgi:uncharacterized damage-inducible protein DinB
MHLFVGEMLHRFFASLRTTSAMSSISTSQRALIELLHGQGAHVDPIACVEDISADLASRRVAGLPHSIAGLVFQMNYWMNYEMRRIRGEWPKYPEHAAESWPEPGATFKPDEWDRLRRDFAGFLAEYEKMARSSREELDRQVESMREGDKKHAGTVEAVLWQMVVHNSYHTGQIVMIRRQLGAWPPRGGGDTW